ncbi:signal peptidase I [Erythrobacter alti]|uniref:signal peptidase I n=1 Tax=Erythrobacter alti TaxID=1896145 RepID=UPI0030F43155
MTNEHIREIQEPASAKALAAEPDKTAEKEDWKSFSIFLVKLVIVVLIFRTLFFTSFNIPSESMMPRLLVGDYLFSQKWSYGYSRFSLPGSPDIGDGRVLASLPERGDIVIFKHPIDESDYIKRVIGLPGDSVQVIEGALHLNGQPVERVAIEDFILPIVADGRCSRPRFRTELADGSAACRYPQFRETLPNGVTYNILDFGPADYNPMLQLDPDNTAPVIVPEGKLFLMGDNRDNSLDSRFPSQVGGGIGLVPEENLVAEASFMYWSTDGSAEWVKPWTWFTAARWSRMFRGI